MTDAFWVVMAIGVAVTGYRLRQVLRRRFGFRLLGRLAGELAGWLAYFLAIAVVTIQTNGGWHTGRGTTVEFHSTWFDTGPILLLLGVALALGSFVYLESRGEIPARDGAEPAFPSNYVAEILDGESKSPREECRRMARALRRASKKTGQPLPPPLVAFVNRHLDRTG